MNANYLKQCNSCAQYKTYHKFTYRLTRNCYENKCKECRSKLQKIWVANNKELKKAMDKKYAFKNPQKTYIIKKRWRINNPQQELKDANNRLIRLFGITIQEYQRLVQVQNNKCKICNKEEIAVSKRTGKVKKLAVDHDHKTNVVRGLLCWNCNVGIGHLQEDLNILKSAIRYLSHE